MPRRTEHNPYQRPFEFPRELSFFSERDPAINRFVREAKPNYQILKPDDAARYFQDHIFTNPALFPQEELWGLFVNNLCVVTQESFIYRGTMNMIAIRPADIFRTAIQFNARAIVLGHNHPSGSATPSSADVDMTKKLVAAGELLDVEILDHVVCGEQSFTSMRTHKLGFT